MKRQPKHSKKNKKGAASLVLTLIILSISTLLIIFAANYGQLQTQAVSNSNRTQQAYSAAVAGLEFGINYLNKNSAVILASPVGGYIQNYTSTSTTNVTLANNSKFSVTYTNPTAGDYTVIKITSVGTSDDGSSTHTVSQLVKFGSTLLNSPTVPITSKGSVSLSGNSQIINTYNNNTIKSGSTVSMSGSSSTILSSGTSSTAGNIRSDITQNNTTLSGTSSNDLFAQNFGVSAANVKGDIAHYYTSGSNTDYKSQLDGLNGTSIWIDQTGGQATISGNTQIGTASNPVLLIINGDVKFSGNVTIYGYVYILGNSTTDLTGNVDIIGGMTTSANLSATGSIQVFYSPTTLTNLQNNANMRYYAKVPGTWKDF